LKFRFGLFENPFVSVDNALSIVHNKKHQDLALEAARESIVLLKNEDNLLPLNKDEIKSIAIIGPNADDRLNQLGDYTAEVVSQEITTVLKGFSDLLPNIKINYIKGCNVIGNDLNEIDKAVKVAKNSDVAIVVLGENEWQAKDKNGNTAGTTGEGYDSATLELTGLQNQLVKSIFETGTKTIAVLINGRPLATPWIAENISAIIEAWLPGEKGGQAIAEIIFGDINPSGKLSVTIPRHAGQLPVYYNYPKSKRYWIEKGWGNSYSYLDQNPLFNFGHGLSYTSFEYRNIKLYKKEVDSNESFLVSFEIENTGKFIGKEVPQLYIEDVNASVETSIMELRGFDKVQLNPGEKKQIIFEVKPEYLSLFKQGKGFINEPGKFRIMIGASSSDIRLNETVTTF